MWSPDDGAKRLERGNVGDVLDDVDVDVDAAQEDAFVKELVVVVQQDRSAVHRRETQRGNVDLQPSKTCRIFSCTVHVKDMLSHVIVN